MANPEHLAILKKGVEAWNLWRRNRFRGRPDLSGAELFRASLSKADLSGANLSEAKLSGADLSAADIREADLCGAELRAVKLRGARLRATGLADADLAGADLSNADLSMANLNAADLSGANLDRINLEGAIVGFTTFANVDLGEAKGLETLDHWGPSTIGIDTIYKSKGKIPHIFLRRCGVPESFIEYMASLVGTGIEFYSLFISYSTKDQAFAERLYADLQCNGVRCWFAPHDLRGGERFLDQIDRAIHLQDRLLIILSPASMESEWVRTEVFKARRREIKENRRVLFPIRLCSIQAMRQWELIDTDTGKDLAREIREFHIPDFTDWQVHDSYKRAFDKLLKDLQGKPDPATA